MPLLAYLAMDDARALTRADFVRLGLVTGAGASDVLPYSARYVRDFEERYCYDQFWNEERGGRPGTRFMSCGHAFVMVGDASDPFFVDRDAGLLGQFRHQYFLLFLIPHIHKATLLMLSDRMVDALNRLDISDAESVQRFKRTIRQLLEIFLRFTHRYWFHEVSDQPQAKELYRMTSNYPRHRPALRRDPRRDRGHERLPRDRHAAPAGEHRRAPDGGHGVRPDRHRRHRLPRHEPLLARGPVDPGEDLATSSSCSSR